MLRVVYAKRILRVAYSTPHLYYASTFIHFAFTEALHFAHTSFRSYYASRVLRFAYTTLRLCYASLILRVAYTTRRVYCASLILRLYRLIVSLRPLRKQSKAKIRQRGGARRYTLYGGEGGLVSIEGENVQVGCLRLRDPAR